MPLKIIARREGFRRCGVAHPTGPTVYPDGTFTPEQIKILKAEPMLIVEEIPTEKSARPKDDKGDKSKDDKGDK